jgi:hypothetical protein
MLGAIPIVYVIALCLIVASIPVIKLVGWIVEGAVDPAMGGLGIAMYVALIAGVMGAPSALKIVLIVVLILSACLMPVIGSVSDTVKLKAMENDEIARCSEVLQRDPNNAPARMGLARALYRNGRLEEAIEHADWLLTAFPGLSPRMKPELDTWKRERDRGGVPDIVICHRCHAENAAVMTHCFQCGAAFGTKAGLHQEIWRRGGPAVVVRGWLVTAFVVTLCAFAWTVLPRFVPIPVLGVLTIASVMVGAWLFLRWVGGDLGQVPE